MTSTYFDITLRKKKLTVVVTQYSAARPMRVTGSGMGDADPDEPEEFEYHLVRDGKPYQVDLTDKEANQIREDFLIVLEGMSRGYD